MCQQKIIKILEKEKRWMTTTEISKLLNTTTHNSWQSIRALDKWGEIDKRFNPINKRYEYRAK
jgi:hypothetical protein